MNFLNRFLPRLVVGAAPLLALVGLLPATQAKAEIIALAAPGFVLHCPCAVDGAPESDEQNGTMNITRQFSRFYMSVDFPKDGQKVCSVALVYRDVNANDTIRARLYKKTFAANGNAYGNPVVMATASSASGVSDKVRIAKTTSIQQNVIAKSSAFYYVLVDAPTINLAFLGVQIDVKSTC